MAFQDMSCDAASTALSIKVQVACLAPGQLALIDRPEPAPPGPGEALVAVAHVGICGTDYHIFQGKHPYLAYPRVMGHEVSGTVLAVGEGVALAPGATVIVNPYIACGTCVACRQGKPNCCTAIAVLGVHRDGAMCERILVPAANLYPTDGLSLRDSAAVDSFVGQMNALARRIEMKRTRFVNPHGLDADERTLPYSTAEDLAKLTSYAMQNAAFRFHVSQKERKIEIHPAAGGPTSYLLRQTF